MTPNPGGAREGWPREEMQCALHGRRGGGRKDFRASRQRSKGEDMGIISWVVLGLVAGAIAKAIHPGDLEPGGVLGTFGVGIVGALVGGFIASAIGVGSIGSLFSLGTWLIAIGGALLLVTVFNAVAGGTRGGARRA